METLINKLSTFKGSILGTYSSFFLIWNWKLFLLFTGEGSYKERILYANEMLRSYNISTFLAYLVPLILTILYFWPVKQITSWIQVKILRNERLLEINESRAKNDQLDLEVERNLILQSYKILSSQYIPIIKDKMEQFSYQLSNDVNYGSKGLDEYALNSICDYLIILETYQNEIKKINIQAKLEIESYGIENAIHLSWENLKKLDFRSLRNDELNRKIEIIKKLKS